MEIEQIEQRTHFLLKPNTQLESDPDIPLFLQNLPRNHNPHDLKIQRLLSKKLTHVDSLNQMEEWRTNLMVVSEKHSLVLFAIMHELHVYHLDILDFTVKKRVTVIDLQNNNKVINNIRLVTCAKVDFVVTVDDGASVRMIYLDALDR